MLNKLPHFFLLGALKAGTTAIQSYFESHREVFLPDMKETLYFAYQPGWDTLNGPAKLKPVTNISSYKACFAKADDDQLRGEICPVYMAYPDTSIKRMQEVYGGYLANVKAIFILRHPVARAYSHYLMHVKNLQETLSFESAIQDSIRRRRHTQNWSPFFDYLFPGFYAYSLKRFMEVMPNYYVCLYEDFKERPVEVLREMETFLGVEHLGQLPANRNISGVPKNKLLQKFLVNPNGIKRVLKKLLPHTLRIQLKERAINQNLNKDTISPQLFKELTQLYKNDLLALNDLIEPDVSHWLMNEQD